MSEMLWLSLSLFAGVLLGAVFFGGLWWTVNKGLTTARPALWFMISWLLRMSFVLLGFYWVGRDSWQRLALCVAGFVIARVLVTWLTRRLTAQPSAAMKEAGDAA